jgi:hypothetical protein
MLDATNARVEVVVGTYVYTCCNGLMICKG